MTIEQRLRELAEECGTSWGCERMCGKDKQHALDPSTVKRLCDVVEAARVLADGLSDAGRDFYAPQLAALSRLDEGEK